MNGAHLKHCVGRINFLHAIIQDHPALPLKPATQYPLPRLTELQNALQLLIANLDAFPRPQPPQQITPRPHIPRSAP